MAGCESCGEKPKCTSQDFTKTVIEIDNPERLVLLRKVIVPASMGDEAEFPPAVGKYSNVILQYEATGALYIYSSDGIPTKIESTIPQDILDRIATLETDMDAVELGLSSETDARERKDNELQQEIDDIKNSPDVVDIVATHADLLAYDTSKLGDNDVIRVLQDETHDGESTYYRWNKTTSQWVFIGSVGDYYTKAQVNDLLDGKQDVLTAGENITIEDESGALVISATGGSAVSQTIFYANLSETGTTRHIYKEASFTTAVTAQEIIDANNEGQVILRGTSLANPTAYSDSYLQNAFIMPHNNDYELVFLDRDLRHEYSVSSASDTNFYYETSGIQPRLTAGTNINISGTTISATDTTYSDFTGTDGTAAGAAGLVPAPATTDAGKFLKADGTWDTAGSSVNVVQTTGASTTDVMSQNAVTSMVFGDPGTNHKVRIGNSNTANTDSVSIGIQSGASGSEGVAIGKNARANGAAALALGAVSTATEAGTISFPYCNSGGAKGVVNFGPYNTSFGYSNSKYRLLTGLYDPQSDHDAATKGYVDTAVAGVAGSYSTSEVDTGATWIDGKHIYKKTIDFGALPNATDKDVLHGITNLDQLVDMNGIIKYISGNNTIFVKSGWTYLDSMYSTQVQVRPTDIHVSTSRNMSDRDMIITLYYTKSS